MNILEISLPTLKLIAKMIKNYKKSNFISGFGKVKMNLDGAIMSAYHIISTFESLYICRESKKEFASSVKFGDILLASFMTLVKHKLITFHTNRAASGLLLH